MSLAEVARRVRFFLRRDRISADLEEEMQLHMELRARREREAGADATEAARRARRRFGNSTQLVEESRDQWGMRWLDELSVDLKYGLRALRRAPVPSAIVIVTLAVGIGATLAMFTVMDAALFRPLPVREPERLVAIPRLDVPMAGDRRRPDAIDLPSLRAMRDIYVDVGAYAAGGLNLTTGVQPIRVQAGMVTPSALRLLGAQPILGRIFAEEEGHLGAPDVVVLSHRLWRAQFGGDADILGKRLSLHDRSYEIIGVMPPRFAFPEGSELWIPLPVPLPLERAEVFRFIISTAGIARLAPGVTRERANAYFVARLESRGWQRREGEPLPEFNQSIRGYFVGDAEARLRMVMGLAALLLLAACANIAGLLLARWSARRRELAVRAAIGASRRRLLRQLATESTVLAAAGALLGLVVAVAALRVFERLVPQELAALAPPRFDGRALVAMLALGIAAALAIGAFPALAAARGDLTGALKSGGAAATMRTGGWRLGSALVVVEAGLAVVLLVGSGLLVKSLARLHAVDTGIRAERVVTARVALSRAKYPEAADRRRFYVQLERELDQHAGTATAALVSTLPLRGEWHPQVAFELPDRSDVTRPPRAELVYASAEYFATLGIRLLAGRTFVPEDTLVPGGGAIISETLARTYWPGVSPIGARVSVGGEQRTIVGVVNDVRGTSLDGAQNPQLYVLLDSPLQVTIAVRGPLPAVEAFARVRDAVRRVDPLQVVYDLKTMEQVADAAISEQRATSALATIFGAVTLLLAALGLYGLLAFGVVQRMPELGIRLALGARRSHIVRGVLGDGVLLAVLGAVLGLGAAVGLTRIIRSQLYDVAPTDTVVYVAVPAILVVTALVAVIVPAIRAARVDPVRVLRAE